MLGGNGLPGYDKPLYRAPCPVHRQEGFQRNLHLHLRHQIAAVNRIGIQLPLGIVIGKAGVDAILISRRQTHFLKTDALPAPDMPALSDTHIGTMIEQLPVSSSSARNDKIGKILLVIQPHHRRKIVLVAVWSGILGQRPPEGKAVPLCPIYHISPCHHRQIPVSGGIDDQAAAVCCCAAPAGCPDSHDPSVCFHHIVDQSAKPYFYARL